MAGKNYVGKAGHLAVMAEFLLRGYNVAMPEVDVGDDIFVVHDKEGRLWRIQVKTAIAKRRGYGFSGKFAVSWEQIQIEKQPDLFYVFALRADAMWEYVIIPRAVLHQLQVTERIAPNVGNKVILTFRFSETAVSCGRKNLRENWGNWSEWPMLSD